MTLFARLEGGPHDGDRGALDVDDVPTELYTLTCPGGEGGRCPMGGVHWWTDYDEAILEAGSAAAVHRYVFAQRHHSDVVYVFGELTDDGWQRVARRRVLQPA